MNKLLIIGLAILSLHNLLNATHHKHKPQHAQYDPSRFTPEEFFDAVWHGNKDKVKAFLTLGANVHWRNDKGQTPLHLAARAGHKKIVKKLAKYGAEIDARDTRGWTPLHYAANNCHQGVANVLIDYGARPGKANNDGLKAPYLARRCSLALQFVLQGKRGKDWLTDIWNGLRGKGRTKT